MAKRMTAESFGERIAQALGDRLLALLIYGSAARMGAASSRGGADTLLIVRGTEADGADPHLYAALTEPVAAWMAAGNPPPLILTETEWRASTDAFAIEYEDIREAHRLLAGRDPWPGITVRREHVRRQLEHELMGKLVHLRQAYAASWPHPKRLAAVIAGTRAGVLTMLRAVLRLAGRTPDDAPEALVRQAGALVGFPSEGWQEPLAYLTAVTRTAEYVNRIERTSS